MKIYKIIGYVYLAFALFFVIDFIYRLQNGEDYWISLIFIAISTFMFFFRMRNYKKFKQNDGDKKQ